MVSWASKVLETFATICLPVSGNRVFFYNYLRYILEWNCVAENILGVRPNICCCCYETFFVGIAPNLT